MTDVIDVKQAVATATSYLGNLMGGAAKDIVLEEVELSDDERFWLVTLSALLPEPANTENEATSAIARALGHQLRRVYRVFKINADTGVVRSMKMRSQS